MAKVKQPIIFNKKTLAVEDSVNMDAHKILYIGRVIEGDNKVIDRSLYTDVKNDPKTEELLGKRSEAFKNIKLAKKISGQNRIDIIPIVDAADGTPAVATVTIPCNQIVKFGGIITLRAISRALHSYSLEVSKGDSIEKIIEIFGKLFDKDKFVGLNSSIEKDVAEVNYIWTLTSRHKGAFCNNYVLELEGLKDCGIEFTSTSFTGGSDGSLTIDSSIFDKISKIRYQEVVIDGTNPTYYDMLEEFLNNRWNISNIIKDGQAWMVKTGKFSDLISFAESKNGFNVSVFYNSKEEEEDYRGSYLGETEGAIALTMAEMEAYQYTEGADLIDFYPAMVGTNDLVGGMRQATIPYFNTLIPWMVPLRDDLGFNEELEDKSDEYSSEVGKLRAAGYCEIGNNLASLGVIRGECRTFFKTDAAGNPNSTYKFLNSKWVISKFSEYLYLRQRQLYCKNRLSDSAGQFDQTTTKSSFINDLKIIYDECSNPLQGRLLLRTGAAAVKKFVDTITSTITLDFLNGEIKDSQILAFNSQVRSIINTLTPIFNIRDSE